MWKDTVNYKRGFGKPRVVLTAFLPCVAVYSENGRTSQTVTFPDSITSWSLQAVGVSATSGMCVATPSNVTVFKEFFLQLDMPYYVVNGEQVEIEATLYNYGDEELTVGETALLLSIRPFPTIIWCYYTFIRVPQRHPTNFWFKLWNEKPSSNHIFR